MRSYPNLIPLSASEVRRIVATVERYKFDRIYGGWWDRIVGGNAKAAIQKSADRYVRWIEGAPTLPSPPGGGGEDLRVPPPSRGPAGRSPGVVGPASGARLNEFF